MGRVSAHIDWISFTLQTVTRTQHQWVRGRIARALDRRENDIYVTPIEEDPGRVASKFEVKLQDPTGANVQTLIERVLSHYGQPDALLTGIEIALDERVAYIGLTDCEHQEALARIVVERQVWHSHQQPRLLARELTQSVAWSNAAKIIQFTAVSWGIAVPEPCWHAYRSKKERKTLHMIDETGDAYSELVAALAAGWNLRDIHRRYAPPVGRHAYVKMRDQGLPIARDRWRARFEVTLRGDRLPCRTLKELADFDFAGVAGEHFSFRRLNAGRLSKYAPAAVRFTSLLHSLARVRQRKRKKYLACTSADSVVNERARQALRTLTDRWRRRDQGAGGCSYSGDMRDRP